MLTGDSLSVEEAHRIGMVSKIFPSDDLAERTVEYARRIAERPTVTALLIKESVNQSVDNMGFYNALQACFTLHQLNHSHWAEVNEDKPGRRQARARRARLEDRPAGRAHAGRPGAGPRPGSLTAS